MPATLEPQAPEAIVCPDTDAGIVKCRATCRPFFTMFNDVRCDLPAGHPREHYNVEHDWSWNDRQSRSPRVTPLGDPGAEDA